MKLIKFMFLITMVIAIFGCSETPNEVPFNSLRNVTFQIDLNQEITDGEFDVENDTISISSDFNNWEVQALTDSDNDGIYDINVIDLTLGFTYEYTYLINSNPETIENRTLTVQDVENSILDYYNELDPTIVIFQVDMNAQITGGNFDPLVDIVDVPGTHNDWSDLSPMTETEVEGIYEIILSTIDVGFELDYKFRINFDWDNSELFGQDDRSHIVVQGENLLEHEYDVP